MSIRVMSVDTENYCKYKSVACGGQVGLDARADNGRRSVSSRIMSNRHESVCLHQLATAKDAPLRLIRRAAARHRS